MEIWYLKKSQLCNALNHLHSNMEHFVWSVIKFWVTYSLELHVHNKLVTLLVYCVNYRQVHIDITSRAHQMNSAIAYVMGYNPYWQCWLLLIFMYVSIQLAKPMSRCFSLMLLHCTKLTSTFRSLNAWNSMTLLFICSLT